MAYVKAQKLNLIKTWNVNSNWSYSSYSNRGRLNSISNDTFTYSISTSYRTTHKLDPPNNGDKTFSLQAGNYRLRIKLKVYNQYSRIPYGVISNASISNWGGKDQDGESVGSSRDVNNSKYICLAYDSATQRNGTSSSPFTTDFQRTFYIPNTQNVYFSLFWVTWGGRSNHKVIFDNIELYALC